ncbi:MAG: pyridoxamine 5'-phosphate oxidase family protein [Burkholderiales bacterium]
MPTRLTTLPAIEAAVWQRLDQAVTDKAHEWRTPVLATINGDLADARTVVLREVSAREKQLLFYTDERAGKVAQLLNHSRGTVVMWSRKLGWQLRCRVRLTLEMSGLSASSRWARVKLTPAAQEYLSAMPPGAPLGDVIHAGSGAVARAYFAVISAEVESIDWLELHGDGNRRAIFDAQGARWIQP